MTSISNNNFTISISNCNYLGTMYAHYVLTLLLLTVTYSHGETIDCGDKTDNGFRSYVERFHKSGGRHQVEWNCNLEKEAKRVSKGCPKELPLFWKGRSIFGRFDLNVEVKSKVVLARQILNSWFYGGSSFEKVRQDKTKVGCALEKCKTSDGLTVFMVCLYVKNEADFLLFSLTSTIQNHGRLLSV
ncbi:hypothetical protein DICVIV_13739 [Dictyocaulus viviparus]|uniref:SCP domain-containing protein n=1 Tax=Dictyocaulus viviparus TaxID=29172 RepID=A0A0D8X9L4_DICVI|nr:hypothetical protein DICVIV_13739 [Dictyocaulus viviparus]